MLSLLAISAPGHNIDQYSASLVNNFFKSLEFLKSIEHRNSPISPNVKVETIISRHSACDADLKAESAKIKIKDWVEEAIAIVPEPIKVGNGNSYAP